MTDKLIVLASDHAGFELKTLLAEELRSLGYEVLDLGTDGPDSVDYPDFAAALAEVIAKGRSERGVLVCGTGTGIAMAANKHRGIRAAVCHDETTARLAREHNNANVLALGARTTGIEVAKGCLRTFLETQFEGGRHVRRVAKIDSLGTS